MPKLEQSKKNLGCFLLTNKFLHKATMATRDDKYYEDTNKIKSNPQGGKAFGQTQKHRENELNRIASEYRAGNSEATESDTDKLIAKFMLYDLDGDLVINIEELRLMMEKLGEKNILMTYYDIITTF